MRLLYILGCGLILCGLCPELLPAQDSTAVPIAEKSMVVIDASMGFGAIQNVATTANAQVRYKFGHQFLTANVFYTRDIGDFLYFYINEPREKIVSLGVLYGESYDFHLLRPFFPFFPLALMFKSETDYTVSASFGVAYSRITEPSRQLILADRISKGDFTEQSRSGIGFPCEVEIVQHFGGNLGYVHRIYGNFNNPRTAWGITVGIQYYIQ